MSAKPWVVSGAPLAGVVSPSGIGARGTRPSFVAPLKSLAWQLHGHGELPAPMRDAARELALPVHAFRWTDAADAAGYVRGAAYLVSRRRPCRPRDGNPRPARRVTGDRISATASSAHRAAADGDHGRAAKV